MLNQLGQLFIIGLKGPELQKEEADFIFKNSIGGVILFERNVESPKQLHRLCAEIQALRLRTPEKAPLLIGVDMEGGRVARLKSPFTKWPPLKKLGDLDSTSLTFRFALAMATELRAVGINLNFAPCVDVLTNPANKVIGDRALSSNPEVVAKLASALVRGSIKGNVIACAKHFPGHGGTLIDSHEDLPQETLSMADLDQSHLIPFKKAFRARLDMVMTSHILFTNIDKSHPVTLSSVFLRKLVREQLRYKNLIVSDDLDMKALSRYRSVPETAVGAVAAGCDLLLYCNIPDHPPIALAAVKQALEQKLLNPGDIAASLQRVIQLKKEYLAHPEPAPFEEGSKWLGHPEHFRIAKAIEDGQIPQDLIAT